MLFTTFSPFSLSCEVFYQKEQRLGMSDVWVRRLICHPSG